MGNHKNSNSSVQYCKTYLCGKDLKGMYKHFYSPQKLNWALAAVAEASMEAMGVAGSRVTSLHDLYFEFVKTDICLYLLLTSCSNTIFLSLIWWIKSKILSKGSPNLEFGLVRRSCAHVAYKYSFINTLCILFLKWVFKVIVILPWKMLVHFHPKHDPRM